MVQHIFTRFETPSVRVLALSAPHCRELEINYYGRDAILDILCPKPEEGKRVVALPFTALTDGFGVLRTTRRTVIGKYLPALGVPQQPRPQKEH